MDERRRYQRYQMADDIYCEVLVGEGSTYKALLYDLSTNGARLRFDEEYGPHDLAVGDKLNIYNYSKGGEYLDENIPAQAAWNDGRYYGIQYDGAIVKTMDRLLSAYPDALPI